MKSYPIFSLKGLVFTVSTIGGSSLMVGGFFVSSSGDTPMRSSMLFTIVLS